MAAETSPEVYKPEVKTLLKVEQISKNFGPIKALDKVSFEMKEGEVLGFLGPNGAGKTTAMRILTGFFPPTQGKVWIRGKELSQDPPKLKRSIGYLPETVHLYGDMQVAEFLNFVAVIKEVPNRKRKAHVEEKMSRCGLWNVRDRLIGKLSKGFRQRVGLAQSLVGDPDILVFDEPTTGLDPRQIIEIRNLIRELGREKTLILSSHILPEVSMVCDRILILNFGKVVAGGTPEEMEREVKDRQQILVVTGDVCRKQEIVHLLQGLPSVQRVTVTSEKEDQLSLTIEALRGQDLRPVISKLFVEHQIPLLEINASKLSLEEIFLKMVVKENNPPVFL